MKLTFLASENLAFVQLLGASVIGYFPAKDSNLEFVNIGNIVA